MMDSRFPLNLPRTTPNEEIYANCIRGYLEEIRKLKTQIEDLRLANESYKVNLLQKENERQYISAKVKSLEDQISSNSQTKRKVSQLSNLSEQLQKENQELQRQLMSYQTENMQLKTRTEFLESKFNTSNIETLELTDQLQTAKREIKKLEDEQANNEARLNTAKRNLTNAEVQLSDLVAREKTLAKQVQVSEAKLMIAQDKATELSNINRQLQSRIEYLENTNKELERNYSEEIMKLKNKLLVAEKDLNSSKMTISELRVKEMECERSNERLVASERERSRLIESLNSVNTSINQSNSEFDKTMNNIKRQHQEDLYDISSQLRESETENIELKARLRQTEMEMNKLRLELAESRAQFTETLNVNHDTHKQYMNYMNEKLNSTQSLCKELAHQLSGSPTKMQLKERDSIINMLKDQLGAAESRVEKYKDAISKLTKSEKKATSLLEQTLKIASARQEEVETLKRILHSKSQYNFPDAEDERNRKFIESMKSQLNNLESI